jgi:hypothetical protein
MKSKKIEQEYHGYLIVIKWSLLRVLGSRSSFHSYIPGTSFQLTKDHDPNLVPNLPKSYTPLWTGNLKSSIHIPRTTFLVPTYRELLWLCISYQSFIKMQHASTHLNDRTSEYKLDKNKINSSNPLYLMTIPKTKIHMDTNRIDFIFN